MRRPRQLIAATAIVAALLAGCTGAGPSTEPGQLVLSGEPGWSLNTDPGDTLQIVEGYLLGVEESFLTVRDVETGELVWRTDTNNQLVGGVGESLTIQGATVTGNGEDAAVVLRFFTDADARGISQPDHSYQGLIAVSLATGRVLWRTDLVSEPYRLSDAPALVAYWRASNDDVVIAQVQRKPSPTARHPTDYRLVGLDAKSGQELWSVADARGEVLTGGGLAVTLIEPGAETIKEVVPKGVAVLDPATGEERWRREEAHTWTDEASAAAMVVHAEIERDGRETVVTPLILSMADGSQIRKADSHVYCDSSEHLVACTDDEQAVIVDERGKVHTRKIDNVERTQAVVDGWVLISSGSGHPAPRQVLDAQARPVVHNLPGTLLATGDEYAAVMPAGLDETVNVYRLDPSLASASPAPPPPNFESPHDPDPYTPPRPAPLADPVSMGDTLWQAPSADLVHAEFHGDAVVVLGPRADGSETAQLVVLDAATGQPRWGRAVGEVLPGGAGEYLWADGSWSEDRITNPQPFLVTQGPDPLVLVNVKTNSCASAANLCGGIDENTTSFGVVSLSLATGQIVWRQITGPGDLNGQRSPGRYDASLFAGLADGVAVVTTVERHYSPDPETDVVTAFDAATGAVLWSRPRLLAKAVNQDAVFVSYARRGLDRGYSADSLTSSEAYGLRSGELLWSLDTPGSWPVAATADHVALLDAPELSLSERAVIVNAADGSPVIDLGVGHGSCREVGDALTCWSRNGLHIVTADGEQRLLRIDDWRLHLQVDEIAGDRYFVSRPELPNGGAANSLVVDAAGTPVNDPLPGRVLALGADRILLLDGATIRLAIVDL